MGVKLVALLNNTTTTMFDFIKRLLGRTPESYNFGVLDDPRSDEEKARDYSAEEVLPTAAENPFTGTKITSHILADENQYGVGACVTHSVGNVLESVGEPRPSHMLMYRTRSNYPAEGCYPHEIVHRYSKVKTPVWEDFPTPANFTEAEANKLHVHPMFLRETEIPYFATPIGDTKKMAQVVNSGTSLTVTIFAIVPEWARSMVTIIDKMLGLLGATVRHQVTVLENGAYSDASGNWFTIIDSAWFGGLRIRYVSEDFMQKRMYHPAYFYKPVSKEPRPTKKTPTGICEYGQRNDHVLALQRWLCMAPEYQTGYYGVITSKKVLAWQLSEAQAFRNRKVSQTQLKAWGGRYFGAKSLAISNQ